MRRGVNRVTVAREHADEKLQHVQDLGVVLFVGGVGGVSHGTRLLTAGRQPVGRVRL